jgi:hypothetical protein
MSKKWKLSAGVVSVFVFILVSAWWYIDTEYINFLTAYDKRRDELLGIKNLSQREASFKVQPSIEECVYLTERYYFLGNIPEESGMPLKLSPGEIKLAKNKALTYGRKCIDLGVDRSPAGWLVRYWLADLQMETGSPADAEENLRMAIRLDSKKTLKTSGWIEGSKLESLYRKIERGSETSDHD